jgi:hypothetical protein
MNGNTLTMGGSATTTGTGDVTGKVYRNSFTVNTPYSFGNQFTTMILAAGGTLPSDITFIITIGAAPSWKSTAVQRNYDIIRTGGNDSTLATFYLHYLNSELNLNNENDLVVWDYHSNIPKVEEHGKSYQSTTDHWVGISNRRVTYFDSVPNRHEWGLSKKESFGNVWNGIQDNSWNNLNNWSAGYIPTDTSNVIIPDASTTPYDPTIPSNTSVKTMTINTGGILNGGSGTLTITGSVGAWYNLGTYNPGTSTVIFTNTNATMSDPTNFYNITVADGAKLTLGENNILRIAGTLSLSSTGILNAAITHNTVEYNGINQTVILPNGATTGYYNLILSGSGTKTMPVTAMTIGGSLTLNGNVSLTPQNSLYIGENLEIGLGCTFNPSTFNHTIAGYINALGTFTFTPGSSITMNSSSSNIINGTGSINFYDLNINCSSEIKLTSDVIINHTLSLTSGKLNPGANTLTFINGNTPITASGGSINLDPGTNIVFGTTGNTGGNPFTLPDGIFSNPTQAINKFSINRTNNITLGQDLSVSGSLDLNSGLIILGTKNINLGTNATVTGSPSSSSMVVAASTGELRKYIPDSGNSPLKKGDKKNKSNMKQKNDGGKDLALYSFTFPVGTIGSSAEYSPVTMSYSSGTFVSGYSGVSVSNTKYGNNSSVVDYLNRYWNITQTGITDFAVDLTFQYLTSDVTGAEANIYGGIYNGSNWTLLSAANTGTHQLSGTALTGFGTFTGGQQGVLPVTLSSFISSVNGRNIKLDWVTVSELNNAGFEVYRSSITDSSKWTELGFVKGSGTAQNPTNYSFDDRNTTTGKYKYRLKQIDYNGNFEYHNLNGEVEVGIPTKYDLSQNYPNPFNPVTKINYELPFNSSVKMIVYDITGREIKTLVNEKVSAGYYTAQLDASNFSSGVYFYRIVASSNGKDYIATKKMVVLK